MAFFVGGMSSGLSAVLAGPLFGLGVPELLLIVGGCCCVPLVIIVVVVLVVVLTKKRKD